MPCLSPSGRKREKTPAQSIPNEPRDLCFFLSFFFCWYIIPLCLTRSALSVSLLLISFGSGSYSNPFLHASIRLILSLLSCCSTWQRIMLGTFFAFWVIHKLCTFTGTYKTKQASSLLSNFLLTHCQYLSAIWPLILHLA